MRKDIVTSKDKIETRNRAWELMRKGLSKDEIYKELEPEYLNNFDLASIISTTPSYEELPDFEKKNNVLFYLSCTICAIWIFIAIVFLICWFIFNIKTEPKGDIYFIIMLFNCLIPVVVMGLAREIKRMNGDIYFPVLALSILGIILVLKVYPSTVLGWILGSVHAVILISTAVMSFTILRKYFFNKMSPKKDDYGNYVFN
jgi:hypothetical protein